MAQMTSFLLLMMLSCLLLFTCSRAYDNRNNYVEDACSVTRYPHLCIQSLSPFSRVAKHNPSTWARAGVSVTIGEAKRVAKYLMLLMRNRKAYFQRRNRVALADCIESFQDTLDNLHRSLGVLRKLKVGEFISQMEDVTTWVSAALTDEDTCSDGFGEEARGKRIRFVMMRVSNVTYMTSNALALVNRLATAGPDCLRN